MVSQFFFLVRRRHVENASNARFKNEAQISGKNPRGRQTAVGRELPEIKNQTIKQGSQTEIFKR
jgi:hypothetical protein